MTIDEESKILLREIYGIQFVPGCNISARDMTLERFDAFTLDEVSGRTFAAKPADLLENTYFLENVARLKSLLIFTQEYLPSKFQSSNRNRTMIVCSYPVNAEDPLGEGSVFWSAEHEFQAIIEKAGIKEIKNGNP
jgi:hypothetical protein